MNPHQQRMEEARREHPGRHSQRLRKKKARKGGGFFSMIIIFLLELAYDMLKIGWNLLVDLFISAVDFANSIFFSNFHGFFAGKLGNKQGTCFDLTIMRTFLTIMLPPLGVFLARGMSGWYNILISSVLCLFRYFPGVIYAFIVIHNASYANRYKAMKQKKRERLSSNKKHKKKGDVDITPLIVFGFTLVLTAIGLFLTMDIDLNFTSSQLYDKLNSVGLIPAPIRAGKDAIRQTKQKFGM